MAATLFKQIVEAQMPEVVEYRNFRWADVSRGKRWMASGCVRVRCVIERGAYYAEVPSLNASTIGVGPTPDAAFDDYLARAFRGCTVRVVPTPCPE